MEIWKDYPPHKDLYEVSNLGRVRAKAKISAKGNSLKPRMLILSTNKDGYKRVNFFINGAQSHPPVHRVVYETFFGPIPVDCEINHKNGIRDDNRPENLEAITHAENVRYSARVLGANYATYGNARMTAEQRKQIMEMRSNGMPYYKIGKALGFSKSQIMNVWHGRCWNQLPGKLESCTLY